MLFENNTYPTQKILTLEHFQMSVRNLKVAENRKVNFFSGKVKFQPNIWECSDVIIFCV